MHIPDNYLSPATCAVLGAAMVPVLGVSIKKVKEEISKAKLPQLGIGAAFSFLTMMFNVPLPGGTTGHAVGGTLIAILLGPYSACLAVSVALLIQALMFGDGGILAFGANAFNMAFVLPFVGYFVYKFIRDRVQSEKGEIIGAAVGSYFGINVAALCAAIEFGLQPLLFKGADGQPLYCPYPLSVSIPAMLIPHLLVAGVVELLFTVFIYAFIRKVSPGMIYEGAKKKSKAVYGLIVALICLTPLGLLATGTAWGEWGMDEIQEVITGGSALNYTPSGMANGFSFSALMPDYSVSGLPDAVGYIASAVVGVALVIIIFKIIAAFKKDAAAKTKA
ncbi:cobalt/nickel transport system permease protein [Sporobacter termitidis DSM 10068]|uniref:Cobalt/nickel transport system permease protein n=1 Tax=Sporobacter termitidis DSM 10068 TaxID=1123282 RepID=A0A1M5XGY3_9FIRM|nr:cobalt transporter CbiM [Sporobacter termitidis]SHH99019.1 cobalt/nickel transport system permease protein [Sporobacter termitidis DSM 10068]